jgi:hypothetical protein
MFAIGITGLNLASSIRYFDIILQNISVILNGSSTIKKTSNIQLTPCTLDQWSNITSDITKAYTKVGFSQWLCPPKDYIFELQGKYTSDIFKYVKLNINKCTNNTLFPNTICADDSVVANFISVNQGATLNFYFINPILNPGSKEFINYYLEDRNYFLFNTATGVTANIYYSEYSVTTDNSILPP